MDSKRLGLPSWLVRSLACHGTGSAADGLYEKMTLMQSSEMMAFILGELVAVIKDLEL